MAAAGNGLSLLIVEDEADFAALMRVMVASAASTPWHVESVGALKPALDRLARPGIDAVLLDLQLPDAGHLEAVEQIHEADPLLPIVVITSHDRELGEEALRRGAQDYLLKSEVNPALLTRSLHYSVFRKRAERDMLDKEEQLRHSQKMEAIGQLAGGVAHDFNNLLTAIRGYAELLLQKMPPADPLRRNVHEINRATDRAAAVTHQLLTFSRNRAGRPRVLDPALALGNMGMLLERLIGEEVELVTRIQSGLGRVRADPAHLEQVVVNLAVNGRDAMPGGGQLTLELANADLDAIYAAEHAQVMPGPYVMLAVSDTGHGMDRETLARVFEPFFTTKPAGRGTGLGLSTVYGIVQQNHGFVWVYSEPGRGSTFKVYLPRVDEAAEEVPDATAPDSARGTETILLVEDEASLRAILRELLESYGYTVIDAGNGVNALRVAEEHRGAIHLLLSDVVMPHMTGRELSERLARRRRQMRVLLMSGYAGSSPDPLVPESAAFIEKPFTAQAFLRRVRDVLSPAS
jgi:two-component system, cell cycle sensor histidine kinase and response regulator CckA